jgi:hypothetical protein
MNAPEIVWALTCPECGEAVWDLPRGSKLAKCWNSEAHESGGPLAFDTMPDDGDGTYYGYTTKAAYDAVQRDKAASPWLIDTDEL